MESLSQLPELFSLDSLQVIAREYGYWAVFFGIMLENMGLPLPGETVTLVGGFLAGDGELRYGWVLACAIAGATLGDNFGYWLGFYGGWPLLQRLGRFFHLDEAKLVKVRDQFSDNADKAVILGRFVALLRIFAGPLAGIARMPYWKFLACNLLGATLWATVMVSLAFFVGRLIPLATLVSGVAQFTVFALMAVVAWVGFSWWIDSRQRTEAANPQE